MKKFTGRVANRFIAAFESYLDAYLHQRSVPATMKHIARKFSGIGSSIDEVCLNRSKAKEVFSRDIGQVSSGVYMSNKTLYFDKFSDDFALIVCFGDLQGNCDGFDFELSNCRMTALMQRFDDGIKLVHLHVSVPQTDLEEPQSYPVKLLKTVFYQEEDKFRFLAENATDVIWVADLAMGKFLYMSPSAEKLFGIACNELTNEPFHGRLTPESRQFFESIVPERIAAIDAGIKNYTDEAWQFRKDGSLLPTEVTTSWIKDPATEKIFVIGVTRDIRLRLEAEKQRAQLEIQRVKVEKAESLAQMTGAIAHQFNNYLQIIAGNLDLIEATTKDSSIKKRILDAKKAADESAKLSTILLAYFGPQDSAVKLEQFSPSDAKSEALADENEGNGAALIKTKPDKVDAQRSVLIIEADEKVRLITSSILTHLSYKVVEAESLEAAARLFSGKNDIDLVLCHLEHNDADMCQKLQTLVKKSATGLIIVSSYDQALVEKKCGKLPFIYLRKPYGVASLNQALIKASN